MLLYEGSFNREVANLSFKTNQLVVSHCYRSRGVLHASSVWTADTCTFLLTPQLQSVGNLSRASELIGTNLKISLQHS
jgi:hypothetical protein